MIYTRWSNTVEITENCGEHQQPGEFEGFLMLTLVKVLYKDWGSFGYQFAESLRADEGSNEIMAAVNSADKRKLSNAELEAAIQKAS